MPHPRFLNTFAHRLSALPKRTLALLTGAIVIGGGATAYAVTSGNKSPRQALLNDVASRLHVSPQQLTSAFKSALIDRIQADVAAGRLTQAQANAIERRIEQSQTPPFFGGGPRGLHHFIRLRGQIVTVAAQYLGLSLQQLVGQLRSSQSLAQIATAHGKSTSGLKTALLGALKTDLDRADSSQMLTSSQEQRILSRASDRIDKLINQKGLGHGPGFGPGDEPHPGLLGGVPPGGPDQPPAQSNQGPPAPSGASGSAGQAPPAY